MNIPVTTADIVVIVCIVALMAYGVKLVFGFFHEGKKKLEKSTYSGKGAVRILVQVEGMMCGQCESHVNEAVRNHLPVKKVSSSHTKGITTIISDKNISDEAIEQAINPTGYTVVAVTRENI